MSKCPIKIINQTDINHKNIFDIMDKDSAFSFFNDILDHSYDEIFVADKNGIVIYCNLSFEKHYGLKREDLIGKHIDYIIKNGYADTLLFDEVIKTKRTITYKQKTKAGKTILNTSKPVLDESGEIEYVVENCRDITENEILYNALIHTKSILEKKENLNKKRHLAKNSFSKFKSQSIIELVKKVDRFANSDINILITGDSGTGKSTLAKYIHKKSKPDMPFVVLNCATIPENLFESELFGYKKGAFTGALNSGKKGIVEMAEGGTLFLDEISEIPINIQSKLLELVQEKEYLPIGDTKKKKADIRIIAATNKNLKKMVENNEFREDLFYRLNVVRLAMPPLRDRKEDIGVFIDHYIDYFNEKYGLNVGMSELAYKYLINYSFPGNIRELEYLIEYLVVNARYNKIDIRDFPNSILEENKDTRIHIDLNKDFSQLEDMGLKAMMDKAEEIIVNEYYKKYNSSYKLAEVLKISQSSANRLINKHCRK